MNVGARDESLSENGLSHFIEHMIFKGTLRRSAFQIAKEFDNIGGNSNAFTTMENTCYHARVMDESLFTMVDIMTDIFLNSVFHPIEMDRERTVILQEISMVEDIPEEFIHLLSEYNHWGEHPLGRSITGPRENVTQFDSESLKDFFQRFYQPDRIVISVAGNVEHQHIVDLISPAFESIKPGNGFPERVPPAGQSGVNIKRKKLEQVHVRIDYPGLSISHPDRYTLSVMNTILGGNMSSRLFQEIREIRGLAYSVGSFSTSYTDAGILGVYAGVESKNVQATTGLILKEIERLKTETVEAKDLKEAKDYIKGSLLLSSESTDNQMARLAQNEIHFGKYYPLEEVVQRIEAVTAENIRELANTLFGSEPVTLTMLGPVSGVKTYRNLLGI